MEVPEVAGSGEPRKPSPPSLLPVPLEKLIREPPWKLRRTHSLSVILQRFGVHLLWGHIWECSETPAPSLLLCGCSGEGPAPGRSKAALLPCWLSSPRAVQGPAGALFSSPDASQHSRIPPSSSPFTCHREGRGALFSVCPSCPASSSLHPWDYKAQTLQP